MNRTPRPDTKSDYAVGILLVVGLIGIDALANLGNPDYRFGFAATYCAALVGVAALLFALDARTKSSRQRSK